MTAQPLRLQAYIPPVAVLGAMLFPQEEEEAERDGWEATISAPILSRYRLQGGEVPVGMINWVIDYCGPEATDARDLRERWLGGTTVGELVKVMFWLTNEREDIASWEKAAEWLQAFDRNTSSSSRRSVLNAKARFSRVMHLWGAYCIRGRHLNDFDSFLAEAEFLRGWDKLGNGKRLRLNRYSVMTCGSLQTSSRSRRSPIMNSPRWNRRPHGYADRPMQNFSDNC